MSHDPTENLRRTMIATGQPERDAAEAEVTLTTDELREQYDVIGFLAPFVVVRRKSDGVKGSLMFTHSPRLYFGWRED